MSTNKEVDATWLGHSKGCAECTGTSQTRMESYDRFVSMEQRMKIQDMCEETLIEQPACLTLQWTARTQEKCVGRLHTRSLADAVTATKQAPGKQFGVADSMQAVGDATDASPSVFERGRG